MSDFDGTMSRSDFFRCALEWLPESYRMYWSRYVTGGLSHFQALREIFAGLSVTEDEMAAFLTRMELEPGVGASCSRLRSAGWHLVIASAGCEWYIRRLLLDVSPIPEIHANPGTFVPGLGLHMAPPLGSPYYHSETGIDKSRIVKNAICTGATVAFAGDGKPDLDPALLVPSELRFARGWLAEELERRSERYRRFESWEEIVSVLERAEAKSVYMKARL